MSNAASDVNVNPIGVPPTTNVTVSTVSLDIAGGSPHKVLLAGQFSADCEGGAAGIVVSSILIDGNLTLNTQINNLEGNTGTLLSLSGVVSLSPGTHRLDLSAFVTNLQSTTAHHRSLSAIDLDADVRCAENIASLTSLPAGVPPCLTVLGYHAPGDAGGGTFYWDASATQPGNGGTIFVPASNPPTGRWKRLEAQHASDIQVRWFGVKDDQPCTSALKSAVAYATAVGQNPSVVFGNGIFLLDDTTVVSQANRGITFIGSRGAALQQGSARPATTLRWIGGAKTMFDVAVSYVNWIDMAVENVGNGPDRARNFAVLNPSGKILLRRVVAASGATGPITLPFTESFIRTAALDYSTIEDCEFADTAPIIIDYDNARSGHGGTWIHFLNNLVDSSSIDEIVFRIKDGSQEQLKIVGNTFNAHKGFGKTLTVVDTTLIGTDLSDPPLPQELGNLIFRDNEYDDDSGVASASMLKLLRTRNLDLENNNIQATGSNAAMIELTDSVAYVGKNAAVSIPALIETLDDASRVFFTPNNMVWGAVKGLLNSGSSAGIVALSPNKVKGLETMVPIFGQLGDPGGVTTYQFDAPDHQPYTIYVAQPSDSQQLFGYPTRGQKVLVVVHNTLGGPMGTVTFRETDFKMSFDKDKNNMPVPFIVPGPRHSRAILFEYDGTHMIERWRGAADVSD